MTKKSSILADSSLSFSSTVISLIAGIISSVLLARFLGPEGKGIYALVILVPTVCLNLGKFGIDNSITYFMAKEKDNRRNIFFSALKFTLVIGVALYMILEISFPWWHRYYEQVPPVLFHIAMPIVIIILVSGFLHFSVLGTGRVDFFSFANVSKSIIRLFLILVAILMPGNLLINVIIASVFTAVLGIVVEIFLLRRTGQLSRSFSKRPFRVKKLVKFGGITHVINVSEFLSYRIDQLLIPIFLAASDLGIYTIAVVLVEQILTLPAAVQMALLPRIPGLGLEKGAEVVARVLRHLVVLSLVVIVAVIALGFFLIRLLYGVAFESAYIPMILLLPGIFFFAFWKVINSYFISINRPVVPAIISVISLFINLALNIILIPRWGIIGASLASTISYSFTGVAIMASFCRVANIELRKILIPGRQEYSDYKLLISRLKKRATGSMPVTTSYSDDS